MRSCSASDAHEISTGVGVPDAAPAGATALSRANGSDVDDEALLAAVLALSEREQQVPRLSQAPGGPLQEEMELAAALALSEEEAGGLAPSEMDEEAQLALAVRLSIDEQNCRSTHAARVRRATAMSGDESICNRPLPLGVVYDLD